MIENRLALFLSLISMRLNKFLSTAGVASRREAERLVLSGKVSLNGQVVKDLATFVQETDKVIVEGRVISSKQSDQPSVWLYYKPKGLITTHQDPQGRLTVFEDIKERYPELPRLISVGRLDLNSEGLLLLTNQGEWARQAELPSSKWPRCYKVRIFGAKDPKCLDVLKKGINIEGIHYAPVEIDMEIRSNSLNQWLTMTLYEGKNREIRKMMEHFGYTVNRLIRIGYGPYMLGDLKPHEIKKFKNLDGPLA